MPHTCQTATKDFDTYLDDLLSISGLKTRDQAHTMTRPVVIVFRSHGIPQAALGFAQSPPAVFRAISIEEWDLAEKVTLFPAVKPAIVRHPSPFPRSHSHLAA